MPLLLASLDQPMINSVRLHANHVTVPSGINLRDRKLARRTAYASHCRARSRVCSRSSRFGVLLAKPHFPSRSLPPTTCAWFNAATNTVPPIVFPINTGTKYRLK